MASPANLISTERQALVSLAKQFLALESAASGIDVDASIEAALAVVAGALVVAGEAMYTPGDLAAMTITPQGRLRVDPSPPGSATIDFTGNPWDAVYASSPWRQLTPWRQL